MDGRDRYLAERVTTATPGQLIKMLLDRLLVELDMAKTRLDSGERPAASPHILRAQDIVTELRSSLNLDAGDIAGQLDDLYSYAFAELVEAHLGGDPTHIGNAATVLAPVQDAWTHVLGSQSQPAAAV
ncbi:MAG: flagellar export chaperone FliS [Acidimicrobiales bacterium]